MPLHERPLQTRNIRQTMNRTKKNSLVTPDNLRDDVESLRDDVRELAGDARRYARQKVNGLADTVRESTGDALDRSRAVVGDEYERALDYVRRNPLAAVSFGVIVGMALGAIFRGRN